MGTAPLLPIDLTWSDSWTRSHDPILWKWTLRVNIPRRIASLTIIIIRRLSARAVLSRKKRETKGNKKGKRRKKKKKEEKRRKKNRKYQAISFFLQVCDPLGAYSGLLALGLAKPWPAYVSLPVFVCLFIYGCDFDIWVVSAFVGSF